ncbi:dihydrofolate reductase [Streptococcus sciuri]|uniref:Dihydrofolate reductase n=1 Tax=Streptococcus sciuri TaxID=2973939 RepID=A0ABT2F4S8_9STRE|nr:dihydrofolate reductase [Streptococcus sciuri]MCS4487402.1 dihydrofolate reductase [Streptococcus sciuri]
MTRNIVALWAEDEHGLIGNDGKLPWHLPKELNHFKKTTLDGALLMGRVTFEGMKKRPLPGRETLVLTTDSTYTAKGVTVVHSVEEALTWFHNQNKPLYIIGGAKVYASFDGHYAKIIKTVVHGNFTGDTYFPDLSQRSFVKTATKTFDKDEKNAYAFTIEYYDSKDER